jgi:peptidoglycan/LPS O-acetylase OafA/YrhL
MTVRLASPLTYNPSLDGLRAIAALLVVADHCRVPGFNPGYFGVDLFFVLSGFLITRLLVKEIDATGRLDLPRFYLRRLLRLAPALLLLLAVYVAVSPSLWPQFSVGEHVRDAALASVYISDYAQAFWHLPRVLVHTWSLSAEEHFYLIWPFAVVLLTRIEPRWRIAALVILYVSATAWRIFEYNSMGWDVTYYRFDTRISGMVCGALLATCLQYKATISEAVANKLGVLACAALAVCLSIGFWGAPWSMMGMTNLAHLAAVGVIIAASVRTSWISSVLSLPWLVGLGTVSYGVYLWHYPAAVYLRGQLPWYLTISIVLSFAIMAATASYWAIERPLQRYRRGLNRPRDDRIQSAPAEGDPASRPQTAVVAA